MSRKGVSRIERVLPVFAIVAVFGFLGALIAQLVGDDSSRGLFLLVSVGALTTTCGYYTVNGNGKRRIG